MLKIALKHFIFSQCIDITFDQILNNFIKPDISSNRMNEYIKRINLQFPDRNIKIKWSPQGSVGDRYNKVSSTFQSNEYYTVATFGSLNSVLNS